MTHLTAGWIAGAVGGTLHGDPAIEISSVVKDSRDAAPGALYIAFGGERVDGHDYVTAARDEGAVLSLVTRPVSGDHIVVEDTERALGELAKAHLARLRERGSLRVVGITGSNGKTTTKDLLAAVVDGVVATRGNLNNAIGLPLTVLRADADTDVLVLEMGADAAGDLAYLTGIAPLDVAVVLGVGAAHVGRYASREALAHEKASILAGLVPGGVAVLNADDAIVARMASRVRGDASLITFGTSAEAQVRATGVELDAGRASFAIDGVQISLSLVGEHHVTNALAAFAVARALGVEPQDAAARIGAAGPASPHRMALTFREDGIRILDDSYNASPESMAAALKALKGIAGSGRSIAVLGAMRELGETSLDEHFRIGLLAVRLRIDLTLVVGDEAKAIYDSAVREGSWGDEAAFVTTIDEAERYLNDVASEGDTILVKASHGADLWRLADRLTGAAS